MQDKPTLCFEYKDRLIPLNEVGKASDETISEFNTLIERLNLKYSFAPLFHLSENEWNGYPIKLHYKNQVLSLKEFVDENKQLSKDLQLPNSINGLEKKHQLQLAQMSFSGNISEEDLAICIEVSRLFQDVYNTFALARFSLHEGFRKLHLYSSIPWDSGAFGQYWIRTAYLNNAIIWYNSCFDILLQTLWIAKQYYIGKKVNNTTLVKEDVIQNTDMVLIGCKKIFVLDSCITEFSKRDSREFVKNKANSLKHRNGLRYKEFKDPNSILFLLKNYNSSSTESSVNIEDVVSNLTSYHKDFVSLIEEVKAIVSEEFRVKYNVEI